MEFYQGLRERNWTSKHYDPDAQPWQIQFFRDSGRFMRPSFDGYRALVTKSDGNQFWVNIDQSGPETFLRDYMGTFDIICFPPIGQFTLQSGV